MVNKKYYIDLSQGEHGTWIENPETVKDKNNLVILTDIHAVFPDLV